MPHVPRGERSRPLVEREDTLDFRAPGGSERDRTVLGDLNNEAHSDFSKAERGKFYRKCGRLRLPIYLDGELQQRLERIAQKKGRDLGEVVSDLLPKDVE